MPKPKRHLKIPTAVRKTIARYPGALLAVGCAVQYSADQLRSGALRHIGVTLDGGKLHLQEHCIPPESTGRISATNCNGEEIVQNDLPLETNYHPVEVPNWGDFGNGTHTVNLPHEAYPREYRAPRLIAIKMDSPDTGPDRNRYLIRFELDVTLDQTSGDFEDELLFGLNLLLENVGSYGIQRAGSTLADYLRAIHVAWEILPPGTVDDVVTRLFHGRAPTTIERKSVEDRYNILMGLRPQKLIYGTSGLQRYFGALLRDNLVVFENIAYGNAIYVMFGSWEQLSQHSRLELLSGRLGSDFVRIVHTSDWRAQLGQVLQDRGYFPSRQRQTNF